MSARWSGNEAHRRRAGMTEKAGDRRDEQHGDDRSTCMNSKASFLHKHKKLLKHLNYKDRAFKKQRYKLNVHQTRHSCRARAIWGLKHTWHAATKSSQYRNLMINMKSTRIYRKNKGSREHMGRRSAGKWKMTLSPVWQRSGLRWEINTGILVLNITSYHPSIQKNLLWIMQQRSIFREK